MNPLQNLTVVMYHYVREIFHSRYPEIKGLDTARFRFQLGWLQDHFTIVTMEQVLAAAEGKAQLPEKAALLTFDDGYSDHYATVFPLLMERGLQGSFYPPAKAIENHEVLIVNRIHFILASAGWKNIESLLAECFDLLEEYRKVGDRRDLASDSEYRSRYGGVNRFDPEGVAFFKRLLQFGLPHDVREEISKELFRRHFDVPEEVFSRELYMTREQLRTMLRAGMHIGSHGYEHLWLGTLPPEKQAADVAQSLRFLEALDVDMARWTMCYPYGSANDDLVDTLGKKACALAFVSSNVWPSQVPFSSAKFLVPRFDTNEFPQQ